MLSIAARCLGAASSPSNQVTSTLNRLAQYSAARLPWAHHVACRPALEKAAFSGLGERLVSLAISAARAGLTPRLPSRAAAPAEAAAVRKKSRRLAPGASKSSFMDCFLPKFFFDWIFTVAQDSFVESRSRPSPLRIA